MSDERSKARRQILQAFLDAWNDHDIEALMSLMTDDCVYDASAGPDTWGCDLFSFCDGKIRVKDSYRKGSAA